MAVFYSGLLHNIVFVPEILNFLKVLEIIWCNVVIQHMYNSDTVT